MWSLPTTQARPRVWRWCQAHVEGFFPFHDLHFRVQTLAFGTRKLGCYSRCDWLTLFILIRISAKYPVGGTNLCFKICSNKNGAPWKEQLAQPGAHGVLVQFSARTWCGHTLQAVRQVPTCTLTIQGLRRCAWLGRVGAPSLTRC